MPKPSVKEPVKQEPLKKESAKKEPKKDLKQEPEKAPAKPTSQEVRHDQASVTSTLQQQAGSQKNGASQLAMGTQPASAKGVGASLPGAGEDDGDGYEDGDGEEVSAADAALSEDVIQQEFGRNFTIPHGFEDYDSFTITFDIKDGKVVNVSPHTKGALVVYTAVKDALLKSKMPKRNRKNIVWVIT